MSTQPPPPLDYAPPNDTPPHPAGRYLVWGLVIGSAFSAMTWIAGWDPLVKNGHGEMLFIVPGVKLAVAITLICLRGPTRRPARMFGFGILWSIAAGFLIFFGSCFGHLYGTI